MARSSRVTIVDVARHAGVSLATVSRAMNGNPSVDPVLAERVRASARELGYSANPLARSLVLGRTNTVSVVIPDLANPTFQAILRGLSRAAAEDGYHVLIADSAEDVAEERALATTVRRRTDGVILCAPRLPQEELTALLPELAPAVVINRAVDTATPSISADYEEGMAQLLGHLVARGHRRIVYLAGSERSAAGRARRRALDTALAADPGLVVTTVSAGVDFDSGAHAVDRVLAANASAVIAYNDLVAMGLLSGLTERGIDVPREISVTGFDDIPFAAYTMPPLTTVAVPAAELGERAWAAMRAALAGDSTPEQAVLTPRLVVRGSTR